jgi:AraC family transcriptional activator of pobA
MQAKQIPTHGLQSEHPLTFRIERIDHRNHYNPLRLHRHDYFEVFIFEKGGGTHLIDFEELTIKDKNIHFVTPGQVHQVRRSQEALGFVLIFSKEFFYFNQTREDFLVNLPFFYYKTGQPTLDLSSDAFRICLDLVQQMERAFAENSPLKYTILQSYLQILLCRCVDFHRQRNQQSDHKSPGWNQFQSFQLSVEQHFKTIHEVAGYARMLGISPRQLNALTQKHAGCSAVSFIHRRIMIEAKRHLWFTENAVSEIGFNLGFEDPAHFSRFVKKCTGSSPSDLRTKLSDTDKPVEIDKH